MDWYQKTLTPEERLTHIEQIVFIIENQLNGYEQARQLHVKHRALDFWLPPAAAIWFGIGAFYMMFLDYLPKLQKQEWWRNIINNV